MSERSRMRFVVLAYIAFAGASYAQQTEAIDEVRIDAAMHGAFPKASPDWLARLKGDQTMLACSKSRDTPTAEVARTIAAREGATIQYPPDGRLLGDWKRASISPKAAMVFALPTIRRHGKTVAIATLVTSSRMQR